MLLAAPANDAPRLGARPQLTSTSDPTSRPAGTRYALYRSYVLLSKPPIEPISHPIRAWVPLGNAQRIEEVTYDPPLYLARSTPVGRAQLPSGALYSLVKSATHVAAVSGA